MNTSDLPSSSWRLCGSAFRLARELYLPVLRSSWRPLLVLQAAQLLASQYFSYASDLIRQRGTEDLSLIAATASLELFFNLLWSALWLLTLAPRAHALVEKASFPPLQTSIIENLTQLVIEEIRVLAAVIRRIPLFVLPAPIEYVRLSLVPYVVIFDPAYRRGEADALETSRTLTRRRWILLGVALLLATILPWIASDMIQGDNTPWIWQNPVGVTLGSLVAFFINLAGGVFLYALYRLLSGTQAALGESHADLRLEANQKPRARTDL